MRFGDIEQSHHSITWNCFALHKVKPNLDDSIEYKKTGEDKILILLQVSLRHLTKGTNFQLQKSCLWELNSNTINFQEEEKK